MRSMALIWWCAVWPPCFGCAIRSDRGENTGAFVVCVVVGNAYLLDEYFDKNSPKEAPTSDTICESLKQAFACNSEGGR